MNWKPIAGFAVAVFDFNPQGEYQIGLKFGDLIELHEEHVEGAWFKGTVLSESRNEGIFPRDFVKMRPDYDDLIGELSIVIKEWSLLMKSYLKEKKRYEFLQVKHKLEMLLTYHQKLLAPATNYSKAVGGGIDPSAVLRNELRSVVLAKIEEGRRQLGQDIIVKTDEGEIANEGNTPTLQLFKKHANMHSGHRLHRRSTKSTSNELRSLRSVFSKKTGTDETLSAEASIDPAQLKHIYLDMKVMLCAINSEAEMIFYLYNKTTNEVMTESFNIAINAYGVSANLDKLLAEKTIFKDITPKEPLVDIYLVCEIYRIGKLIADKESLVVQQNKKDGKKKGAASYRRPFAIGVLPLAQTTLKPGKEAEFTIPLWSVREETQFYMARELAIKGTGVDPIPRADGVRVGLNLIVGSLAEALTKNAEFAKTPITPRINRVSYPGSDFDAPRNDLYVTFVSGDFLATLKSPRVKLYVRSWNAKTQELKSQSVIWRGTGQDKPAEEYQCYVILRCDKPMWNNTIKLQIPPLLYPSCHMFFSISESKDAEEKKDKEATMMAYLGLTDAEDAILQDNVHTLTCFKPGKGVDSKKEPSFYIPSKNKTVARRETIKIKTQLISNQISQNGWLYKLITWSTMDPAVLPEVMNRITFVDAFEISRFMKETLDAIFALFDSKMVHLHDAVFIVLVFVIGILTDEKKTKVIPASRTSLEKYLENDFKLIGQFTHKHLIKCMNNYFSQYEKKQVSELNSVLKSLEFVLKFTLKSRVLFKSKSQIKDDVEFKKDLITWLDKLYTMMENPRPIFLGPQTIAIQALSSSFSALYFAFSAQEMASIANSFLGKIRHYEDKKMLNIQKLLFLHALAASDLFKFVDVRNSLLPTVIKQLRLHVNSRIVEERNESIKVLQRLLETIELQRWICVDSGNVAELMQIIPDLQQALLNNKFDNEPDSEEKDLHNILIVLFAIYHLMEPEQYDELLSRMPSAQQVPYITSTLKLLGGIVAQTLPSFPENWFSLIMFQNSVVLKVFMLLGHSVEQRLPRINDELEMWSSYFKANLDFVNCASLNLEAFSEAKRKMILARYGDMRRDALEVLEVIWNNLGVHQFKFVEQMVVPIIELMLSEQREMKMKGNALYLSLMTTEFTNTKHVDATARITTGVLSQLFDKLLQAYPEPQSFFLQALGNDLQSAIAQEPAFGPVSSAFLQDMQTVIVLLRDSNSYPIDEIWIDEVAAAHLRLIGYLAKTNRWKTWAIHLHQLFKTHLATSNLTEAANTLLLHADKINWNDQKIHDPVGSFPRQTGAERKELLLRQAIDLFNQAKMWECAFVHITELLTKFANDPLKAKELQDLETLFQQNIATSSRFFNEYFYVGYFGKGYHPSIRNKEFIYRGNEFARLDDFASRIQAKFPDAKNLTYTNYPPPEILNSPGKHLQIFAVKPRGEEPYTTPASPRMILDGQSNQTQFKFFQSNRVKNFIYSKSVRKNKQSGEQPEDEVADTWITNTVYTAAQLFPHLQRRIEIVKKTAEESSPIQVATNQVLMRSTDVAQIVLKHKGGSTDNLVNFTMVLQGTINPTVNQGTKLFKKAFLGEKYAADNPDKAAAIQRLRETIIEQVEILSEALTVHAGFCSPEMAHLQEELERNMAQLRQEWGLPPLPGSELLGTGTDPVDSVARIASKMKLSFKPLTPGITKSPAPIRKPSAKPNPK